MLSRSRCRFCSLSLFFLMESRISEKRKNLKLEQNQNKTYDLYVISLEVNRILLWIVWERSWFLERLWKAGGGACYGEAGKEELKFCRRWRENFLSCSHFITKLRIASECQVDQAGRKGISCKSDFAVKGITCLFEETFWWQIQQMSRPGIY